MKCPFEWMTDFECVYKHDQYKSCEDIEICPGNSDAWCTSMIEKAIKIEEGENHV